MESRGAPPTTGDTETTTRRGAPPCLATARLRMVPFDARHAAFLHALFTDPDVRRYLWDDRVVAREEVAAVIEASARSFRDDGYGFWAVLLAARDEAIGFAGLRAFGEPPEVELLYGLLPAWWGRGLATEAGRAVLRHGFETCRLPRIFAGADPPNARSFRVMERLGMRRDGPRMLPAGEALYHVLRRDPDDPAR